MITNHEVYYPLYEDKEKFIILVTGGRGSGKSYGTSAFIERMTFEMNKMRLKSGEIKKIVHNILYTRYTMTSASISVIPEFLEKVDADGVGRYFSQTKSDVKNLSTGAKIMFRGIKTSSGNQTAKLKSIHGITTFVVDEAEEWRSEQEFDTIRLSLRQKGIQNRVIIIMNPTDSNHFIYQKYIKDTHKEVMYDGVPVQISTHPNVLHIHTTYLDNMKHLSEQFLKDVRDMKERNPEKYAHIVIGQWADVAEGAIFKNWSIINEWPTDLKKEGCGMDLGYSADPTALIRCGVKDNCLYLWERIYQKGLLINELIKECKKYSTKEDGTKMPIYMESADPRMVDELSLGGLLVYPVDKSGMSIIAGIEKIKDFDHIYVMNDSYSLKEELRNYTWAKDMNGNFINQPIDAWNHACFSGESLISTDKGLVRIVDLKEGDMILTADGYRPLLNIIDQGIQKTIRVKIKTTDGFETELVGTPDHKIKTDKGWTQLQSLEKGDKICLAKSLMEKSITYTEKNDTFRAVTNDSMSKSKCLVQNAEQYIEQLEQEEIDIARNVPKNLPTQQECVKFAEANTAHESTIPNQDFVVTSVLQSITIEEARSERVYDLEVMGQHNYVVNGVLAKNCDAFRYYVLCAILGKVLKPKRISGDLGIF